MTARHATAAQAVEPDPASMRRVLGHFCTGVAVIAAHGERGPVGFACQSFAALSLEPPLVLFCPSASSGSWPVIERTGSFTVNVLGERQRDISGVFGAPGADKFAGLGHSPAPSGAPLLDGVLTWADCDLEAVHPAGDHYIVVGRVTALGGSGGGRPLLFYRGRYTVTEPDWPWPAPQAPEDPLESFLTWPHPDDWA
jgi:3-hydroxy-9,10-secoandrosta-1,3,5(10)-triene-9,17-dione monooxygenase reductase component